MNWYLIYTRPNWENKVVDHLQRKGIENYCPYNRDLNEAGNRRKVTYKPLFTSFVFVRVNALLLTELKKIDGIVSLVFWLDKPAVIRDIEIEMMRRFLNEHINVQLEKNIVNINGMVKITNGDLCEEEGDISISSKRVKLVLPSLGYSLVAEVSNTNVELIVQADLLRYNSTPKEDTVDYGL
ncbi:antitermination protein NusG [Chitinophagaceae bacterium LB-8]|uniref:Antitermination protein NusG n=1 Tax=Paraflavisolibacter caeni TaxID=2982496 RepID=A0A9X2XN69_9BACT|nr:transcription termination/antitermination NusG family protein [Paraflavisolibacter caeni]MCU7548263.1 antitermination protein NusG [Paraflavisolibacter caeni]